MIEGVWPKRFSNVTPSSPTRVQHIQGAMGQGAGLNASELENSSSSTIFTIFSYKSSSNHKSIGTNGKSIKLSILCYNLVIYKGHLEE